jgi:hypothetical protein
MGCCHAQESGCSEEATGLGGDVRKAVAPSPPAYKRGSKRASKGNRK